MNTSFPLGESDMIKNKHELDGMVQSYSQKYIELNDEILLKMDKLHTEHFDRLDKLDTAAALRQITEDEALNPFTRYAILKLLSDMLTGQ